MQMKAAMVAEAHSMKACRAGAENVGCATDVHKYMYIYDHMHRPVLTA